MGIAVSGSALVGSADTPVPCRPSLAPVVVLRDGGLVQAPRSLTCDTFGSANTALGCVGAEVRLPARAVGDVVVFLGQRGLHSLVDSSVQRARTPAAMVIGS